MLIELYGQNFGCFRDEFRLSMLATDVDPNSDRGIIEVKVEGDDEPLRLLRAVAIYGPNGSGKSTVLRAAAMLDRLISTTASLKSDETLPGYEPFALEETEATPVHLGMTALINGRLYEYQVAFDAAKFISERLTRVERGDQTTLIDRSLQNVKGEWTRDERFSLLSKDFRSNALLLSVADSLTPALAQNIAVGIRRLLRVFDANNPMHFFSANSIVASRDHEDPQFKSWLLLHLKSADIGVVDLKTEQQKEIVGRNADTGQPISESRPSLSLFHRGSNRPFPIPYGRESQGTQRLVKLAPLLYDLTREGPPRAVFVDEIDSSLHPELLLGLIQHFNCDIPSENARGQLIFVTHETTLLDAEAKNAVLRRDQIYLTEKDASGAARLYSVAEFKERNNHNLRRRYLQGRYGALPALGTFTE